MEGEVDALNKRLAQLQRALLTAKKGPEKDALKEEINELDDLIHAKSIEIKKAKMRQKIENGEEGLLLDDEMGDDFFGVDNAGSPEGKFADSDEEEEHKKKQKKKALVAQKMLDNDPEAKLSKELADTKAKLEHATTEWAKDTNALAELRDMMKNSESGSMAKVATADKELQQLQASYQLLEDDSKKISNELAQVTYFT